MKHFRWSNKLKTANLPQFNLSTLRWSEWIRTLLGKAKSASGNICKAVPDLRGRLSPPQVLNTVFWLGKAANGVASYAGPSLNLKEFEGLLAQMKVVSGRSLRAGGAGCGFPAPADSAGGRGEGKEGTLDWRQTVLFFSRRSVSLFQAETKEEQSAVKNRRWIVWILCAGFCCVSCTGRVTSRLFLGHRCFFFFWKSMESK